MPQNLFEKINHALDRVKLTDKLFFTKNLSLLIRSGIPLADGLQSLIEQTESVKMRFVLTDVSACIQKGESFSDSLKKHPKIFSEIFVNMIHAGEESGKLEDVLNTLALQLYKEHELVSKVKGALAYPVVVFTATIGITAGLIVFVIPKLTKMFSESGMQLPLATRILIMVSNFLVHYFYISGTLLVACIIGFLKFRKMTVGKKVLHKIILSAPVMSRLVVKFNLARLCRTLSSLLRTDIPVVRAFTISSDVLSNIYYKESLREVSEALKSGSTIHKALKVYPRLYPPTVTQMVTVGEETGRLDEILEEVAKFYEDDLDNILKNLPALLEPVLIIFLGLTVGGVAISIMMPIFSFTSGAGGL